MRDIVTRLGWRGMFVGAFDRRFIPCTRANNIWHSRAAHVNIAASSYFNLACNQHGRMPYSWSIIASASKLALVSTASIVFSSISQFDLFIDDGHSLHQG